VDELLLRLRRAEEIPSSHITISAEDEQCRVRKSDETLKVLYHKMRNSAAISSSLSYGMFVEWLEQTHPSFMHYTINIQKKRVRFSA
jgi:hypothetical protein